MLGWIIRFILVIAGFVTSFFIAYDAPNFEIIRMVVALLLFAMVVMMVAFWPRFKKWVMNLRNKK